jgi:copper chaperone CopZ
MRKLVLMIALIGVSFILKAQSEKVEIKTSAVCGMCKSTIERDLAFEKGVKSSTLDLDTKILTVEFNAKRTSPDKIRTRVTKIGYHADSLQRDAKAYAKLPLCCQDGGHEDGH